MPQPTQGDLNVDRLLTSVLVAFTQEEDNFVATTVFPDVPTVDKTGFIPQYDRGDWNRVVAEKRAPGAPSAGSGFSTDNTTRFINDVWAVHKDVDGQTRALQQDPFMLDRDATRFVAQQMLMRKELEWSNEFFTTGVWTGSISGGDVVPTIKWNAAGSDPITDITEQAVSIARNIGRKPNKLVFSMDAWDVVRNHPEVQDRIKHTQRGIATEDIVASLIGVDQVLVLRAIQTTSDEGVATTTEFIGGNERALLLWTTDSPSILAPSAGYHTTWTDFIGAQNGMRMKNFRIEEFDVDRIEGEAAFDPVLVSAVCGVFFNDVLT